MSSLPSNQFLPLPTGEVLSIAWPTVNHFLLDAPEKFFARTRINPDYGKPGFTRDCGKRFHWGCDIAPVRVTATGKTTWVIFTDCATDADFESEEPTFVPQDKVFCVFEGRVVEVVEDENASDFGKHVIIEHVWPRSGEKFFTVYGHLAEIADEVRKAHRILGDLRSMNRRGQKIAAAGTTSGVSSDSAFAERPERAVAKGQLIGKMGQTAQSADARNWMAIAPHLHFEARDAEGRAYEPVEFLRRFL